MLLFSAGAWLASTQWTIDLQASFYEPLFLLALDEGCVELGVGTNWHERFFDLDYYPSGGGYVRWWFRLDWNPAEDIYALTTPLWIFLLPPAIILIRTFGPVC